METAGPLSSRGHDWVLDWGETEGEVSGLASGLDVSVRVVKESRVSPRRRVDSWLCLLLRSRKLAEGQVLGWGVCIESHDSLI